jgi:hypothetical protein
MKDIPERSFGGEHQITYQNDKGEKEIALTQNVNNAYMMIYERKEKFLFDEDGNLEVIEAQDPNEISPNRISTIKQDTAHKYFIPP